MDRIKEFLRKKGFYIALGTGVLAVVGLMVVYNYNYYREELGVGGASVDLNAPEESRDDTEQAIDAKIEPPVTETNSADAVADNTDAIAGNTDATVENTASGNAVAGDADNNTADNPGQNTASGNDEATVAKEDDGEQDETAAADSDGVIVNAEGEIVANSYDEGGALVWPVEGTVVLPYSMDTTVFFKTLKSYRCNPGVLIAADEGSNVLSAYEGVVESVTEDKEHGTVVTVIMGNGYKAKYGQLMNVTVSEGDVISTAQNIGEVAPVTSYYAEEGNHVYFELQKDGKPVNPVIYMQ